MGCLKGATVAGLVVPTADYVRFATHYGFRPDFCEGHDPESKGLVENLVGYVKSDLMIPAELTVADLAAANAAGVVWRAEVNAAVHSEISAVPDERLAVERDLLRPLPSLRARIGKLVLRKVDRLSCVRFGSARYSVPTRHIGRQVEVRVVDGQRRGRPPRRRRSPSIPLFRLGRRRSTTTTTAARRPHPGPGGPPQDDRRDRVLRPGTGRRRVHQGRRRGRQQQARRRPRRARRPRSRPRPRRPDRRPGTGRRRSVVTGRATSARSSPPAPASPARPDPAKRSSIPLPAGRHPTAVGLRDRRSDMTAPAPGARRRSRGRPPPAAARRDAPPRPRAARHRQDPALVARRVPPHPRRSRDRITRRVQRPRTGSRPPGSPSPRPSTSSTSPSRRSSRRPSTTSRSLEWIAARENVCLVGPAGTGKSHLLVALGHAAVDAGQTGPLLHRRRARRDPLPRPRRQQRRPRHRDTSCAPT